MRLTALLTSLCIPLTCGSVAAQQIPEVLSYKGDEILFLTSKSAVSEFRREIASESEVPVERIISRILPNHLIYFRSEAGNRKVFKVIEVAGSAQTSDSGVNLRVSSNRTASELAENPTNSLSRRIVSDSPEVLHTDEPAESVMQGPDSASPPPLQPLPSSPASPEAPGRVSATSPEHPARPSPELASPAALSSQPAGGPSPGIDAGDHNAVPPPTLAPGVTHGSGPIPPSPEQPVYPPGLSESEKSEVPPGVTY